MASEQEQVTEHAKRLAKELGRFPEWNEMTAAQRTALERLARQVMGLSSALADKT